MRITSGFGLGLALVSSVCAQELDKGEIIKRLDPSNSVSPYPTFRDVFGRNEKGVGEIGEDPRPSVDLHLPFEYNSDKLTFDAITTLRQLGPALNDKQLFGFRFLIAGYTDAKGTAEFNMKLSQRRAQAVRDYLVAQYDVDPGRLDVVGFGLTRLADPLKPEDGINRRVQVTNLGK
jgi:outer membrane protein OmpA-like peptidoglycan-associated protein